MQTKDKVAPDWTAIEAEYTKTSKPIRELARWFSISDTAIRKKAKAEGWARTAPTSSQCEPTATATVSPVVSAAASDVGAIIGRGRNLVVRLMDELETATTHLGELETLIEQETAGEKDPRRRNAMLKAVDLPVRAAALKNLANALKTLNESRPLGKKEEAQEASETAGQGTEWGSDLATPGARPN